MPIFAKQIGRKSPDNENTAKLLFYNPNYKFILPPVQCIFDVSIRKIAPRFDTMLERKDEIDLQKIPNPIPIEKSDFDKAYNKIYGKADKVLKIEKMVGREKHIKKPLSGMRLISKLKMSLPIHHLFN